MPPAIVLFGAKKRGTSDAYKSLLIVSPFAKGMPRESPGRIGCFVGYKIVNNYMDKNPSIDIDELMKDIDAQLILKKSKYKPKR